MSQKSLNSLIHQWLREGEGRFESCRPRFFKISSEVFLLRKLGESNKPTTREGNLNKPRSQGGIKKATTREDFSRYKQSYNPGRKSKQAYKSRSSVTQRYRAPLILPTLTNLISKSSSSIVQTSNYADLLFNSIPNPSTFCFNTIVRVHTILSSPLSAFHLFVRMRRLSVPPDFHSFPFALKACAQLRILSLAQMLHSQVLKFGFGVDLFVLNSLVPVSGCLNDAYKVFDESSCVDVVTYNVMIDGFVKAGEILRARELFEEMPLKDSVSWNTLIAGYAQMNHPKEAIELFKRMLVSNSRPDNFALVSALSACGQLGELDQGKIIHGYIKSNRIRVDSFLSTGLVDMYAKCGDIETAVDIFESSENKNLFTWNAMIVGLAMHGHGKLSLEYFSRMMQSGLKPDGVSFLGVLTGCSHAGLVDKARQLFNEMEDVYKVPRELKHYGCMADLLGRAGLIREGIEMIKSMPMGGDMLVWSGLLGGCRKHGDVMIAESAAEHVMELKPEDGGVYSIMAEVYAKAERWEDYLRIRESTDNNKLVKKNAGCSFIQLNGVKHEFVAGDDLHPQTDEIHFVLQGILSHQI
ncbi:pentatricopeptide repeat-containing protein At5g61800-like [Rutidosis leptorrhynchoides]|uniref:pentatricopeptide repeat-containing protein At5g61800-like n=1 Tax=Rutidosis leptorrhynchoides TaxID=125765 RepID=UPI003A98FBC5